jgi:hypothetical protein
LLLVEVVDHAVVVEQVALELGLGLVLVLVHHTQLLLVLAVLVLISMIQIMVLVGAILFFPQLLLLVAVVAEDKIHQVMRLLLLAVLVVAVAQVDLELCQEAQEILLLSHHLKGIMAGIMAVQFPHLALEVAVAHLR